MGQRRNRWRQPVWAFLAWALPGLAHARHAPPAPLVTVRAGTHATFSRVVFTVQPGTEVRSQRLGDLLVLTFPRAGRVPGLAEPPSHILSVQGGLNQAALGIPAGTETHLWQLDRRVIVDVFAAPPPAN